MHRRDMLLATGALIGLTSRLAKRSEGALQPAKSDLDFTKTPFICFTINENCVRPDATLPLNRHGHRLKFAMWDDGLTVWAGNWELPDGNLRASDRGRETAARLQTELADLGVFDQGAVASQGAFNTQLQLRVRINDQRIIRTWHNKLHPGWADVYDTDGFRKFVVVWYSCIRALCAQARNDRDWKELKDGDGTLRGYDPTQPQQCWWMKSLGPWMP